MGSPYSRSHRCTVRTPFPRNAAMSFQPLRRSCSSTIRGGASNRARDSIADLRCQPPPLCGDAPKHGTKPGLLESRPGASDQPMASHPGGLEIVKSLQVQAPPARVLQAFFDAADLAAWWQVIRSVTVPRPLGTYAVEWNATEFSDEVLGRLGGALHGTVMDYRAGAPFFIADAYWQPPDGDPVGPMAFEVQCRAEADGQTVVTLRQSGDNDGPRWERYFQLMDHGWDNALADLKRYLDEESLQS